eukprot:364481-Chlamydomonas_euryale.AAC.21
MATAMSPDDPFLAAMPSLTDTVAHLVARLPRLWPDAVARRCGPTLWPDPVARHCVTCAGLPELRPA